MDFTSPAIGQNYSSGYTAGIIQNQKDLAKFLDSDGSVSYTGLVAGVKRYNSTNQLFERRNSGNTAWEEMPLAYAKLASPTFTGTPLAPTAAVDTNTTQIATTAFVVGQAGSANPTMNGTVAVGTSLRFARQDHVHPVDTSRAPLFSPNFSGTPQVNGQIIYHAGNFTPSNYALLSGATFTGDITTYRAGAQTTGVIYLGNNSGTRYLYYDGTNYQLNGASVYATGFGISSERRLKQDIVPMTEGALDRVKQWQLYEYAYKEQPKRRVIGMMAEEADRRVSTGKNIDLHSALFELAAAVQELARERVTA